MLSSVNINTFMFHIMVSGNSTSTLGSLLATKSSYCLCAIIFIMQIKDKRQYIGNVSEEATSSSTESLCHLDQCLH